MEIKQAISEMPTVGKIVFILIIIVAVVALVVGLK